MLLLAAGGVIWLVADGSNGMSARLRYHHFETQFSQCQLLLNTTSGPEAHLIDGIEQAQKALDGEGASLWDPAADNGWWRWLTPREQTTLREHTVELILRRKGDDE